MTISAGLGTGTGAATKLHLASPVTNGTATLQQTATDGAAVYKGMLLLTQYTVAGAPTCDSTTKGGLIWITDATTPTYNGTLTGGGAVGVSAGCDGTAWHSN